MEQERSASLEFLKRVLRQGKDQAWVVSFDIGVHMYQPLHHRSIWRATRSISWRSPAKRRRTLRRHRCIG
jgi:hypothetical protein